MENFDLDFKFEKEEVKNIKDFEKVKDNFQFFLKKNTSIVLSYKYLFYRDFLLPNLHKINGNIIIIDDAPSFDFYIDEIHEQGYHIYEKRLEITKPLPLTDKIIMLGRGVYRLDALASEKENENNNFNLPFTKEKIVALYKTHKLNDSKSFKCEDFVKHIERMYLDAERNNNSSIMPIPLQNTYIFNMAINDFLYKEFYELKPSKLSHIYNINVYYDKLCTQCHRYTLDLSKYNKIIATYLLLKNKINIGL